MPKRNELICVVGGVGVGKTSACEAFSRKHGIPHVSISDVVRRLTVETGLAPTRENCGRIANEHAKRYGYGVWCDEALRLVRGQDTEYHGRILLTGPRRVPEAEAIINDFSGTLVHMRTHADQVTDMHLSLARRAYIANLQGEPFDAAANLERAWQEWYGINEAIDGIAIGKIAAMAHFQIRNDVWMPELANIH